MSRRAKSSERRAEIVRVTLALLAETPLASLTTRQIAGQLGISQPALFRHFRSREQLLLAVMSQVRRELGAAADAVLNSSTDPRQRLHALAGALLDHVTRHPGLPRLLFSPPEPGLLRIALQQQVSMLAALVSELVRDGQRAGQFRADLEPTEAATFFVGMIQGLVLHAQLAENPTPLAHEVAPMLAFWLDGAGTGDCAAVASDPSTAATPTHGLVALDVRPILAGGTDPLDAILAALRTVMPGGVLTLTAPFRPAPLLTLLRQRGHRLLARQLEDALWSVDIVVDGEPAIEELTELEPPEPLERVLAAASAMPPNAIYLARLPRVPRLLLPHLGDRAVDFEIAEAADDTALLRLVRT